MLRHTHSINCEFSECYVGNQYVVRHYYQNTCIFSVYCLYALFMKNKLGCTCEGLSRPILNNETSDLKIFLKLFHYDCML